MERAERIKIFEDPNKSDWDQSKIKHFWRLIWKYHIQQNNFTFWGYVFPKMVPGSFGDINMNGTQLKNAEPLTFKDARFLHCIFLDEFELKKVNFEGDTQFRNVTFQGRFRLSSCSSVDIGFSNVNFNSGIVISLLNGKSLKMSHSSIKPNRKLFISGISYCKLEDFSIQNCSISDNLMISDCQINELCSLSLVHFNNFSFTNNVTPKGVQILKSEFNRNFSSIIELPNSLNAEAFLTFLNCELNQNVTLKNIDFSKLNFNGTELNQAKFRNCTNVSNRIVLSGEKAGVYLNTELSEIYRRIKFSFENDKNWDMASKAFRSEMHMKRLSLFEGELNFMDKIVAFFEYSFYLIYDGLSGYNQSVVRPFVILFITIGIGAFYYSYFESNSPNDGLQMSFGASFPYLLKVAEELTYDVWWVKLIQTFLSSILIAFFIIALRKKFKQ